MLSSDVHWVKMKAGRRKGNSSLEEIIYEESSTFGGFCVDPKNSVKTELSGRGGV